MTPYFRGNGVGMAAEYLPDVYVDFSEHFPEVARAQGELARVIRESSPWDERTNRLLKLAMAIGAEAQGAVRSNVRKALDHGASPDEVRHVALMAITTCGFPTAIAGLRWVGEVLEGESPSPAEGGAAAEAGPGPARAAALLAGGPAGGLQA